VFFQLGAGVARASIPDWKMLGRLRAKSFDLDRGFPNGLSGGGVFNAAGELVGIATRNISVNSHGAGGAGLQLGRAVEVVPVLEELR
jgi:S1-C subfamily serine protease